MPVNRNVAQIDAGDTLTKLSKVYGLSVTQLQQGNGIADAGRIRTGQGFTPVPHHEFGLGTDASAKTYVSDIQKLQADWPKLTPVQRYTRFGEAVNRHLVASGVPKVAIGQGSLGGAKGKYDFTKHTLMIEKTMLDSNKISGADFRVVAQVIYHEGRHAEQWFDMARVAIAKDVDPATMGMTEKVIAAAKAAPKIDLKSEDGRFVNAMYESVYGAGGNKRNAIVSNITNENYGDYRRLPEEADAWRIGGKVQAFWPR